MSAAPRDGTAAMWEARQADLAPHDGVGAGLVVELRREAFGVLRYSLEASERGGRFPA